MKKTHSVAYYLKILFAVLLILLCSMFAFLGVSSFRKTIRELEETNARNLYNYSSSFSLALESLQEANKRIITNPYFDYLALGLPDSEKVLPMYFLRQILEYQTPYYAASFIYDGNDGACDFVLGQLFQVGSSSIDEHQMIRDLCTLIEEQETAISDTWFLYEAYGQAFLVRVNQNCRMFLCSLISLHQYVRSNPIPTAADENFAFVFSPEAILLTQASEEDFTPDNLNLPSLFEEDSQIIADTLVNSKALEETPLCLGIGSSRTLVFSMTLMQMMPLCIAILLVTAAVLLAYFFSKRVLIFPLQQIANISHQIQGERNPVVDMDSKFHPAEFDQVKVSLRSLIDQVQKLEAEKSAKEFEKEQALLQYYQLQARSHFLLNCLKSLYSSVDKANPEKLKMMIISISNHLRYIFHDGVSLIPLEYELQEIHDYKNTIQSSYIQPLIVLQDVPNELMDCLVPPLILQTFFENAVKYSDKTAAEALTVRIQISQIEYNQMPFLQIHISDNGVGYASETLEKLNAHPTGYFDEKNIGINNLKRRISILFDGNYHTAFYNLPSGGACSILFIPLRRN